MLKTTSCVPPWSNNCKKTSPTWMESTFRGRLSPSWSHSRSSKTQTSRTTQGIEPTGYHSTILAKCKPRRAPHNCSLTHLPTTTLSRGPASSPHSARMEVPYRGWIPIHSPINRSRKRMTRMILRWIYNRSKRTRYTRLTRRDRLIRALIYTRYKMRRGMRCRTYRDHWWHPVWTSWHRSRHHST